MEREGEKVKANEEKEKEKEVNEDSRGRCRPKIQLDPDLKLKPIPFTKITDALGNVYQEAKTESGERVSVKVDNDGDLEFVQSPRFDFSDEKETRDGLAFLERHGYVIVKEVLTKEEIEQAHSLFWDFVEGIRPRMETLHPGCWKDEVQVSRFDMETWDSRSWPSSSASNGIIGGYGAGHSPFQWFIRSRPRVRKAFEAIWGTSALLCSFDGLNVFRPWSAGSGGKAHWRTRGGWFHVDQNPRLRPGRHCVQGLVTLTDCTEASGGLVVIPGSQEEFESFGRSGLASHAMDFIPIPSYHLAAVVQKHGKPRVLLCPAGDLCLWDSRTIHCNAPGRAPLTAPAHSAAAASESGSRSESGSEAKQGGGSSSATTCASAAALPSSSSSSSSSSGTNTATAQSAALPSTAPLSAPAPAEASSSEQPTSASPASLSPAAAASATATAAAAPGSEAGAAAAAAAAARAPARLLRLVSYQCMTPLAFASEEVLRRRRKAFEDTQTTSHWPHAVVCNGPPGTAFSAAEQRARLPWVAQELIDGPTEKQARGACVVA